MSRHLTANQVITALFSAASAAIVGTAVAAPPAAGSFGLGSTPHAPQFMLYLSRSLGGGGGAHPGLRLHVEQVRMRSTLGDLTASDPMTHRELVNWRMEGDAGVQLELGQRVTWDVTGRSFGRAPQTWNVEFESRRRLANTSSAPSIAWSSAPSLARGGWSQSPPSPWTSSSPVTAGSTTWASAAGAPAGAVADLLRAADPHRGEMAFDRGAAAFNRIAMAFNRGEGGAFNRDDAAFSRGEGTFHRTESAFSRADVALTRAETAFNRADAAFNHPETSSKGVAEVTGSFAGRGRSRGALSILAMQPSSGHLAR